MSYIYDLTDTWNAAGTVFTSIKMNVTNSASANGSKLIDLQIGGASLFNVDKSGNVGINIAAPSYRLHAVDTSGTIAGFRASTANTAQVLVGNTAGDLTMRTQSTGDGFIYSDTSKYLAFGTSATERMRITAAGDVAVGTTSTASFLGDRFVAFKEVAATTGVQNVASIVGASTGSTDSTFGARLLLYTDNPNGNYWPAGIAAINDVGGSNLSALGLYTATSGPTLNERMRIDASGNVGIGTSSPSARLHAVASSSGNTLPNNAVAIFESNANNGIAVSAPAGNASGVYFPRSTSGYYAGLERNGTDLIFRNNDAERMRLDSAGTLGIGATPNTWSGIGGAIQSPYGALSGNITTNILHNAYFNSGWKYTATGKAVHYQQTDGNHLWLSAADGLAGNAITFTERMRLDGNGNLSIGATSAAAGVGINVFSAQAVFGNGGGATGPRGGFYSSSTSVGMALDDSVTSSGSGFVSGTDYFVIERTVSTGNVLIGNSSGTGAMQFATGSGATERMRITAAGDVGIGTTSPGGKFEVVGTGLVARFGSTSALNAYTSWAYNSTTVGYIGNGAGVVSGGGSTDFGIGATGARPLLFGTNDTERMRITSTGNLQLGTASLATTATDGFPYIPTCAGVPTGTPTAITGYAPMVVDSTNNKLYVYVGGAWQAMN